MSVCPCCKQEINEEDPIFFPTTSRDRIRMWVKLATIAFGERDFTVPQVVAFVEKIADPEDLEEIHRQALMKEIREYLYHNDEIKIILEGKPGKPFIFRRIGHAISNTQPEAR